MNLEYNMFHAWYAFILYIFVKLPIKNIKDFFIVPKLRYKVVKFQIIIDNFYFWENLSYFCTENTIYKVLCLDGGSISCKLPLGTHRLEVTYVNKTTEGPGQCLCWNIEIMTHQTMIHQFFVTQK